MLSSKPGPIGIFDSGYGGLTILHGIRQLLPEYDYLYLGDNARAPYGPRSFDVVYEFTRQAVVKLFEMGCHLVILGCNTASAKALRSIQQIDLPKIDPERRVLGVIRPTAEVIGSLTKTRHVGVLATEGTIKSESYNLEIRKLYPDIQVSGVACPFWVPLVEYNEADSPGADYFVKKRIDQIMRLDAKDTEVSAGRRTRGAAGGICGREPEGLSGATPADGAALRQRRHGELPDDGESGKVQGAGPDLPTRTRRGGEHQSRINHQT